MSKKVLGIGLTVAGMALMFIPGVGQALGLAAIEIGLGLTAATVVGMGLMFAGSMLIGPSVPKMPASLANGGRDRLSATLDVRAPRKILLGKTAGATDVRYQTWTGAEQEYLEMIVCVASHKVNSIYELRLDNELAWSSAGGVVAKFSGYLTVTTRTEGTSANGVAIDSVWAATATLTGCAYLHLKFKVTGPDDQTPGPFSSGVTQRMTIRCEGASVYDPRLDSTVTGGSGAHRADNQATWAWSANGSSNPALQLLFYLLGWKINGKLALGMGLPQARIDLPSFITAANICDESVTRSAANGGGAEPRYRTNGVLSESDDRNAVVEALCAHMNAILRDSGGKLALTVLKNDLATPVASFTEDDVLNACEWDQTPDLSASFNIVRGQRIDPSDNALYQPVDYPEVKLVSNDGIDRIDTFDLPLCESNGQAQRLAKQRLQRNQYQGRLRLAGKPKWWQVNVGDIIQLSHQSFGWSNKLFRCAGQQISRTGATELVLVEEHPDLYQWDNDESAAVTPGAPTIYDPAFSPILMGIAGAVAPTTGNMLTDILFGGKWTKTAGAVRRKANATGGHALGFESWFLELSPSTSAERSALSEKVPVTTGLRYYFRARAQRGTTLGTGSRLNFGGRWLAADGTTVIATAAEGAQQTPSSLTAGAVPVDIYWSDVAPAGAVYFQMKAYTPALASSSGTFRVEGPWVAAHEPAADVTAWIAGPPQSTVFKYSHDGVAEAGQFTRNLTFTLNKLSGVVASGITWTYKVKAGTVNGFTAASAEQAMTGTGTGTLTVSSLGTDTASVEVKASYGATVATAIVPLSREYADPPVGGGGGGSGSETLASKTSGFTSINSTAFTDITGAINYTTPSGVTAVNVVVNLAGAPTSGPTADFTLEMKVQRNISSVWTDIGTVRQATSSWDVELGAVLSAQFNFTQPDTGLTGSTAYEERIMARLVSGTRQHNFTGSVNITT